MRRFEMGKILEDYKEFLRKDKKLSLNTLLSYRRDTAQYVHYLREFNYPDFNKTDKTTIINYVLYLQRKGKAVSTISRTCLLYTSPSPRDRQNLVCRLLLE